jgi:hypothetical protein
MQSTLRIAVAWRERINEEVTFLTHDKSLAAVARSYDFRVVGVDD